MRSVSVHWLGGKEERRQQVELLRHRGMFCLQGKIIFSYLVAKNQFFFLKDIIWVIFRDSWNFFVVLLYDQQGVPSIFFQMLLLSISMAPVGVSFGEVFILGHSSLFIDMLSSAKKTATLVAILVAAVQHCLEIEIKTGCLFPALWIIYLANCVKLSCVLSEPRHQKTQSSQTPILKHTHIGNSCNPKPSVS